MKKSGYFFLIAGFLLAAYATALDTVSVNWVMFVTGACIAAAGVAQIKKATRKDARSDGVLAANRTELKDSLENIVTNLEDMQNASTEISVAELREQIDTRLRNDLRRFADARESMIHLFGLQTYADLMSSFAAGERYINRVWSASADGYEAEARNYLQRAANQFRHARQQLQAAAG